MADFGHQSMHNERNVMSVYKINEWAEFRKEFQRLLPDIPIIDLHDALLSAIENKLVIDVIALGKRLQNIYPEEWEYMSMQDIIVKHYGMKAMKLIESVL